MSYDNDPERHLSAADPIDATVQPLNNSTHPRSLPDSAIEHVSDSTWHLLFQKTLEFTEYQIERLRWRGEYGGVLPCGFDAHSLAAQAIKDFLTSPERSRGLPANAPSSSSSDSTVQRCNDLKPLQYAINGLVLKHVARLRHLKENRVLSNEIDLARAQDMDDEPVSPTELIPDSASAPDDALSVNQEEIRCLDLKSSFTRFLGTERRLIRMLGLGWDGICKPQAQAAHLKLGIRTVRNLRKRLRRKWHTFMRCRSSRALLP